MKVHGIGGGRAPEVAIFSDLLGQFRHAPRHIGAGEIVGPLLTHGLKGEQEQLQHQLAILAVLVPHGVADAIRRGHHLVAVPRQGRGQQLAVIVDEARLEAAGGTEIQQHDLPAFLPVLVVGKIGIGLHHAQLEQLHEHQLHQGAHHPVALGLGQVDDGLDGLAGDIGHGQHRLAGQLRQHMGHQEALVFRQQVAEGLQELGLLVVVGLILELALGVFQQGLDVQFHRQQAGHAQQRGDIVHVAVYARRHAGVLHLEHDFAPVRGHGPVHLADGGRRQRLHLEAVKHLLPVFPVGLVHHLAQLDHRHVAGVRAQPGENIRQLPGQEIAGVHGQDLPHLHGRAAHGGQLVRHPAGVGRGQQHVPRPGALARAQLPGALGEHTAGDPAGHARHPRQPTYPRGRYGPVVVIRALLILWHWPLALASGRCGWQPSRGR